MIPSHFVGFSCLVSGPFARAPASHRSPGTSPATEPPAPPPAAGPPCGPWARAFGHAESGGRHKHMKMFVDVALRIPFWKEIARENKL